MPSSKNGAVRFVQKLFHMWDDELQSAVGVFEQNINLTSNGLDLALADLAQKQQPSVAHGLVAVTSLSDEI